MLLAAGTNTHEGHLGCVTYARPAFANLKLHLAVKRCIVSSLHKNAALVAYPDFGCKLELLKLLFLSGHIKTFHPLGMIIENIFLALNCLSASIVLFKLSFPVVKVYPEDSDLSWMDIINQLIFRIEKYNKGSTKEAWLYLPAELPVGDVLYSFYLWGMVKSDRKSNKKVVFESNGLKVIPLLVRDVISQVRSSTEAEDSEDWESVVQNSLKRAQRRVKNGVYFETDGQGASKEEREAALGFSKLHFTPSEKHAAHKQRFLFQSIISILALSWLVFAQYKLGWLWLMLWVSLNVSSTFSFIKIHNDTKCFHEGIVILKNNDFAYRRGSFYWLQLLLFVGGWLALYFSSLIQLGDY